MGVSESMGETSNPWSMVYGYDYSHNHGHDLWSMVHGLWFIVSFGFRPALANTRELYTLLFPLTQSGTSTYVWPRDESASPSKPWARTGTQTMYKSAFSPPQLK